MGDNCSPKNVVAITRAENQASGDIFHEAERLKNFSNDQLVAYESHMARLLGGNSNAPRGQKFSALDALPKITKINGKPGVMNDRAYAHPSEMFSKKFYGSIDKRFQEWAKKGASKEDYSKMIGSPAAKVLNAIDKIMVDGKGSAAVVRSDLRKLGLEPDQVYDARDYLSWLRNGGPTQGNGRLEGLTKIAGNLSKAQANANLTWTLGNNADMIRVFSHFATKKGAGMTSLLKGAHDLVTATKGNIFRQVPELAKQGVYKSLTVENAGSNLNPFEWSITAQKNVAWYLDKATGGNGFDGVRDAVFDAQPWDRPYFDREKGSSLIYGLVRYPINETRWLFRTSKSALTGDKRAVANLLIWNLARSVFFGTKAQCPAPIWAGLNQEQKKTWNAIDEMLPVNLTKKITGTAMRAFGIDADLDLSEYLQPIGGTLGARAKSLGDTAIKSVGAGVKSVTALAKGNIPASAASALAALSAANNLSGFTSKFGALGEAVNSTTITNLLETTGKSLAEEFDSEKAISEYLKDLFGQRNIKKQSLQNQKNNLDLNLDLDLKLDSLKDL